MPKKIVIVPAKELQALFQRALNCWEPQKVPGWAVEVADALDAKVEVEILTKPESD